MHVSLFGNGWRYYSFVLGLFAPSPLTLAVFSLSGLSDSSLLFLSVWASSIFFMYINLFFCFWIFFFFSFTVFFFFFFLSVLCLVAFSLLPFFSLHFCGEGRAFPLFLCEDFFLPLRRMIVLSFPGYASSAFNSGFARTLGFLKLFQYWAF